MYNPGRRLDATVDAELACEGWGIEGATAVAPDSLQGVDAVLVMMLPVSAEVIAAADGLRLIQAASRGYDAVDIDAATRHGIPVCNTHAPGHADTVAEHTFALLLAVAKRIPEGHAGVIAGGWPAHDLVAGVGLSELVDKTLGIIGLGEIGKQVAKRAKAFGMQLLYVDDVAAPELEERYSMQHVGLDDVLGGSDVVSIHVPLLDETAGMIGAREIGLMKRGAILLNTSRGPVVDLDALAVELHAGRVRAGLDVFEPEPPDGHPILSAPGLVCSPHLGGVTTEMLDRVLLDAIANIRRLARGERLEHVVNGVGS